MASGRRWTRRRRRIAGFGGEVEVLSPPAVRALLVAAARQILERYPGE
jgi:predicted DNA-binding transcriptional regulator YafY